MYQIIFILCVIECDIFYFILVHQKKKKLVCAFRLDFPEHGLEPVSDKAPGAGQGCFRVEERGQ